MDDYSPSSSASAPQMRFGKIDDLMSRVAVGIDGARKFLFSQQHEEGYWCGELEADTTLESDYILLHTLFGTGNQQRFDKAARYILNHQNADGGWGIYAGGPSNISASVKAYFGLKLAGAYAEFDRARAHAEGGLACTRLQRRFDLARLVMDPELRLPALIQGRRQVLNCHFQDDF